MYIFSQGLKFIGTFCIIFKIRSKFWQKVFKMFIKKILNSSMDILKVFIVNKKDLLKHSKC